MQTTTSARTKRAKTASDSKASTVRPYEAVIIMHPDATVEVQKELFRKNKKIVEDHSGTLHNVDTWGKRNLGNPVDRITRGIYFHATFMADNKAVAELERTMRINDKVIRFLHTRLPDETDLGKFMEHFKSELAAGAAREREREAKAIERRTRRQSERSEDHSEA